MAAVRITPKSIWSTLDAPWCQDVCPQQLPANAVVLINTREPHQFLTYFWTGLLANAAIILANPAWKQQEWRQVSQQICPNVILGDPPPLDSERGVNQLDADRFKKQPQAGQLLIATGGTSGHIKFVIHTWDTLVSAAQGFLEHFDQQPVNSYCVLPLYHVSGLMQAVRVWLSGGRLITQSFKQLEAGQRLITPNYQWFISLVPTQLQRLLGNTATELWLRQFRAILLGGAPAWPQLLAQANQLPIALTYGMSETAAQVATLRPQDFAQGCLSNGSALPHVTLAIHQLESDQPQPTGSVGRIALQLPSLGLGYWPNQPLVTSQPWFYPDDLGYLDAAGHLHVVGRRSQKIITGGENVFPSEIEAALLATGQVSDVCVVGVPDQVWGQVIAAAYVSTASVTPQQLKTQLKDILSAYKHPKRWQQVAHIPRNQQGKVNRAQVLAWLTAATPAAQD